MRLTRADVIHLLLLWLGGIDLRLTMLAVPPLTILPDEIRLLGDVLKASIDEAAC